MPLDVYLQPRFEVPRSGDPAGYVCSLDDDGCYWFLHPLFEQLAHLTGKYIDLYGRADFSGTDLDALLQTLTAARALVAEQPEEWDVVQGVRPGPEPEELRATVRKSEVRSLLDALDSAARSARITGQCVTFFGD